MYFIVEFTPQNCAGSRYRSYWSSQEGHFWTEVWYRAVLSMLSLFGFVFYLGRDIKSVKLKLIWLYMWLEVNILSPCKFNMITVAQEMREMSVIRIFKLQLKLTMNCHSWCVINLWFINVCLPVRVMILNVARVNQNFKSRRARMGGIIFPFFNVCPYHVHSANLIMQVKFITELQQWRE